MSGGNEQVGFLLEIMKARTTASQAVVCEKVFDEGTAGPLYCGTCIADSEVREEPDKPSPQPKSHSTRSFSAPKDCLILKGFDFYGNPIRGKDQSAAIQVMQNELPTDTFCGDCDALSVLDADVLEQPPLPSLYSPKERLNIKRFDFYGNPVFVQEHQQRTTSDQKPTSNSRSAFKQHANEDYSEFLEVNPPSSPEDIDQSWMGEFGNCLGFSITHLTRLCHADEESGMVKALREEIRVLRKSSYPIEVDDDVDVDPSFMAELGNFVRFFFMKLTRQESSAKESDIIKALRNEIRELRNSLQLSDLVHEFKMRNDLANLQQQTTKMEEMYTREIAREIAHKAHLKAQLQMRLLQIKEDRMTAETQMSQTDSLMSHKSKLLSTAKCILTDPPVVESIIKSPLSKRSGLKVAWEPTISISSPKASALKNPDYEPSITVDIPVNDFIRPEVLLSPTLFRSPHEPPVKVSE